MKTEIAIIGGWTGRTGGSSCSQRGRGTRYPDHRER